MGAEYFKELKLVWYRYSVKERLDISKFYSGGKDKVIKHVVHSVSIFNKFQMKKVLCKNQSIESKLVSKVN
jgi:hypothetical protein